MATVHRSESGSTQWSRKNCTKFNATVILQPFAVESRGFIKMRRN